MKRVLVGAAAVLAVVGVVLAISYPAVKLAVKREILKELRQFVREGTLEVEEISGTPKRRQARIYGVTVKDSSGRAVVRISRIDADIRRIHGRHIDASLRLVDPVIDVDLDRVELLGKMVRWEAFLEKTALEVDRVDVQGGLIRLSAAGILAEPETLAFDARAVLEGAPAQSFELRATGPRTTMMATVSLDAAQARVLQEGTALELATTNLALLPKKLALMPDSAPTDVRGLKIRVVPADTSGAAISESPWSVSFGWGPLSAEFRRIRRAADTGTGFDIDEMRFQIGEDQWVCSNNRVTPLARAIRMASGRWSRVHRGLPILAVDSVALDAGRESSTLRATFDGFPVVLTGAWGARPRLAFSAETISIPSLLHAAGESAPISGLAGVQVEVTKSETSPEEWAWKARVSSSDLQVRLPLGGISVRATLAMEGVGSRADRVSGVIEPAAGVPIVVSGRGNRRIFSGRAAMKDRPIKDIQMLGEILGKRVPLKCESGRAGLEVDFLVKPNLEFRTRGRLRIEGATASTRGFPFRVEGLDVDIPFEYTPDTGQLVLDEAAAGRASAQALHLGPYRLDDIAVTTASKGDKIYANIAKLSAFDGAFRGEVLFHFSKHPHQHTKLSVEGVSLRRVLAPFADARDALTGTVRGEIDLFTSGDHLNEARGTVHVRATEGPGEPMMVSGKFLERIGGPQMRKLRLPKQVPYKNGNLKVSLAKGRISFDEASLEAHTLLRKVRIGEVVGTYRLKDLVDVLSNVSAGDVKVEVGGKKRK